MVYKTTIPASNDNLNVSQGDIQQNFLTANTIMSINHFPFTDPTSTQGKHKFVDMPVTTIPTIAAGDGGLYTKTNGQSQLYYTADAGGKEYQLTKIIDGSSGRFGTNPGWIFLPGGLIMQYGSKTNPGTTGSIVFNAANIDFPTSCFYVFLQLQHNSSSSESATVQPTPSTSGFSYRTTSSSANTILYWWAIGN